MRNLWNTLYLYCNIYFKIHTVPKMGDNEYKLENCTINAGNLGQ